MLQMTTTYIRRDTDLVKESAQRLYELEGDVCNLNLSELLFLVIERGTKKHSLEEIVSQILVLKDDIGLKNLTVERLSQIEGLTEKKAQKIMASLELGRRIYTEVPAVGTAIRSPEDAAGILDYMKHHTQEHFVALYLNTKNVVIGKKTVFKGSLNASIVHPREVFREAVQRSAASIVVGHSHPSGDPTPSREDIEVTQRPKDCGKMMGIEVLDHIIIGSNRYTSLKEKGYL